MEILNILYFNAIDTVIGNIKLILWILLDYWVCFVYI